MKNGMCQRNALDILHQRQRSGPAHPPRKLCTTWCVWGFNNASALAHLKMAAVAGERVFVEGDEQEDDEPHTEPPVIADEDADDASGHAIEASDVLLQSEILQPDRINEFQVRSHCSIAI